MPASILTKLRQQRLNAMTEKSYQAIVRLIGRGVDWKELREELRACMSSPAARGLEEATARWLAYELQRRDIEREWGDFWMWSGDRLMAYPHGGADVWVEAVQSEQKMIAADGRPKWPSILAYDMYRLFQRIRRTRALYAEVQTFCERWHRVEPFGLMAFGQPIEAARLAESYFLSEFDPDLAQPRPQPSSRALLAWRRVIDPLLTCRWAPLEYSWQELSDEQLREYLKHALSAQLRLVPGRIDRSRAQELGDRSHQYLKRVKPWDVADS